MAEIYGVTVKNIRCGKDHEGCAMFDATIYLNGKKLGHWSQSYMCGPDEYDFDESLLDEAVEKFRASDIVEPKYKDIVDADILISKLIGLVEDEKGFKHGLKEGHKTFIVQEHGFRESTWLDSTDKEEIKKSADYYDLAKGGQNVLIYTSPKDFIIDSENA